MFAGISQPFLSSNYMSNFHFPIINHIGKMKSGPSIFFHDNKVIKLYKIYSSIIFIYEKWWRLKNISSDSDCIRLSTKNTLFDLFHGEFWTFTIIWCGSKLITFALLAILLTLIGFWFSLFFDFTVWLNLSLMLTKAWVSKIIFKEHFFYVFIDCETLTLYVRLIFFIGVVHGLIRVDIEPFKSIKDIFYGALYISILS